MEQNPSRETNGRSNFLEIPHLYEIRRLLTVSQGTRHWLLSWAVQVRDPV
jgi:hypothetical protein